jgi:hypothetical protein
MSKYIIKAIYLKMNWQPVEIGGMVLAVSTAPVGHMVLRCAVGFPKTMGRVGYINITHYYSFILPYMQLHLHILAIVLLKHKRLITFNHV